MRKIVRIAIALLLCAGRRDAVILSLTFPPPESSIIEKAHPEVKS